MDALTIPRLRARLLAPGQTRKLASEAQRGGDAGRAAAERLGRIDTPRPPGVLIWVHAPEGVDPLALVSLQERLEEEATSATILLTSDTAVDPTLGISSQDVICQLPPVETARAVQRFLDHWMPDVSIWLRTVDKPLLLDATAQRAIPLLLQDAVAPVAVGGRARNLQRQLLGLFDRILAPDVTHSESIRTLGAIPARIETTGPLTRVNQPPACIESEREDLAAKLHARPIWLVACPAPSEIDAVLTAHRLALRSMHRLLLILVPVADHLGPDLASELTQKGFTVARREAGEDPDAGSDVFIVDCVEELGLCYRLSPVAFLGGTLSGAGVPNPMDAATLGSAIIAGPNAAGEARIALDALDDAGACRRIPGPAALGPTVVDLLAPDTAARLAVNAWDAATEGVQVLDRLAQHVLSALRNRAV
ncbi:3-deoxy-D-manno-octulosonic acid transferase [Tropicimonas marinistellae]|uniref:3-deoxy-D-manno-octulosonic acid transferase n=1 Tax=Tropicimonas marinistellae TaxID=1739787 RepID=UPI000831EEE5|nr:glycosyltransferase N-terminal domain-containing protein [Tropicimonas marinistellae]